ncbi:MAG: YicC/YloC family endoribonuclease [Acutalibacteraceae bacterium]|nr:YicC/YloC family endoribonuclease [Acutalibacteraceae bacterium]
MTGFGRAKISDNGLDITLEIKSVNHRYFEFTSRLPKGFGFLEEKLKSFCMQNTARGKVEVSVLIDDSGIGSTKVSVNEDYAVALTEAVKSASRKYGIKNDVKMSSLILLPDFLTVKKRTLSDEAVTAAVLKAADEAMKSFILMRATEGEKLKEDVMSRTKAILGSVEFIEKRSPETVKNYRERLEKKIKELLEDKSVDEQRLLTETAIFADKVAVAEETVRLRSHISQLTDLLNGGGAVGRKLDFIVQEMNRETNTIGSKAQDVEITRAVVDMKSEIEKIREQIQNIE